MRSLAEQVFDFTKSGNQMLIIQGVRVGFLVAILVITVAFQSLQSEFVSLDVLLPIYSMMALAFLLNGLYLYYFEKALGQWVSTAFLFAFESAFITGLIYFTGINQSIFLFLYLVNIILCGFVFQRKGAFILSLWTSILFSFLLIIGPEVRGQTLFFAVGLNNLAFFAVAGLSGLLSEQLGFMGIELKERGKDLRVLRNLNDLIIGNMATGLITVNSDGLILQSNRAASDILGSDGPLIGHNVREILPTLLERLSLLDLTQSGRRAERFDLPYENVNNEKLVLEVIVSPMRDAENQMTGYVVTFEDLTKVRRLELAMRQSETMAAVGGLAAGIAHEIRNPLASISGSIQLLGMSLESRNADDKKLMSIVLKEIDRLNNLITEFLDYVRPSQLKDEPVDLNALMREVLDVVRLNQNLRQDVVQKVELRADRRISGESDKLKQAFLNIVINSYQAMTESETAVLEVSTAVHQDSVILKIRDTGMGIEPSRLRRIFEPFHTTKPKGTGLGLAVVHKIIENHNGKVFVESEKGHGTEFTMEFPVRAAELDLAETMIPSDDLRWKKRGNG